MKIAYCTTCRGRAEHLKATLPQNLRDNPDGLFIVLDYGCPERVAEWVWSLHEPRAVGYRYEAQKFSMAHAKNMAHRLGIMHGADVLVNLDADNFAGAEFDRYLAVMFALFGQRIFLCSRMVARCNAPVGEELCVLPRGHEVGHSASAEILGWLYPENERPLVRGISGRIVVTRAAFLRSGGYDESKYAMWGPDDKDFNSRLQKLGFVPREINGRYLLAIHHSEKLRFKEYPHLRRADDSAWGEVGNEATAVVNAGSVGCGDVVGKDWVVKVPPVPTRVWGVGFHKTGTTSLAQALKVLGYESAHWETPRWARTAWEEMRAVGKSLTLERYDAVTDFPVALLWREIDRAYPGSKFILTVRDEESWLRSVKDHWSEKNPWRGSWEEDCFTHRLHTEVYGRKAFDADVMIERYRRHNAEVREYFANRPGDLLEMSTGWDGLVKFLGKETPSAAYPHENQS